MAEPSLFELPARPFTARALPYDLHSSLHSLRAAPVDTLASLDHSMRKALYAFGRRPVTASTHRPASAREVSAGSGARAAARLCELWPQAEAPPAVPRHAPPAAKGGLATPPAAPSAAPPSDIAPAGAYDDLKGWALVRARLEEITGRPRNRMWEQIMQGWKAKSLMQALRTHIGPLHNLDDSEVAVLLGHSQLHTLKRYAELWRKATPMDSFYVLIRGALRRTTRTGARQPVGVGAPLAGGAWLREPVYHIDSMLATEASIVLQINVRAVQSDTKLARLAEAMREELGQEWKALTLRTVPFFSDLPPFTLRRLAPLFRTMRASKGTVLIAEGTMGAEMYVLVHGSATVTKCANPLSQRLVRVDIHRTRVGTRTTSTRTFCSSESIRPPSTPTSASSRSSRRSRVPPPCAPPKRACSSCSMRRPTA